MDNVPANANATGERSAAVGHDLVNSVVATGDNNVINLTVGAPSRVRTSLSRATWRRWLTERRLEIMVAVVLVGLTVAAVLYWRQLQVLPAMTGNLNVAVVDFVKLDARGEAGSSQPATTIARQTATGMQQVLTSAAPGEIGVQVWDPNRGLHINGSARAERGQAAQALAQQINAQVLIYGAVTSDGAATTLVPEFYLSETLLQGAEELAGQYELGSPIVTNGDYERNPATVADLRDRLLTRTRALVQFMFGLGQFTRRDLAAAERLLSAADTIAWDDRDGKELLYLYLGNTAGVNGKYEEARKYYQRALDIRAGYSRALLGLAEAEFETSGPLLDCDPERVNPDLLRKTRDDLVAISSAPLQPAVSNVPEKTLYLLGRVDLCMSQAGLDDRFDLARTELQSFIASYEKGKPGLRDFAAEAHASLALVAFPETGETSAQVRADAYRRALTQYEAAKGLSQHRERQAEFSIVIGFLHAQLGEPDQAAEAYASAFDLDAENRVKNQQLRTRWEQSARAH